MPREDTAEGMSVEFSIKRTPETARSKDQRQIWFQQRSPLERVLRVGNGLCLVPCRVS